MPVIRFVPRSRDDQVLGWIADRVAGISAYRIAKNAGVNSGQVVDCINKVRAADEVESGEDASGAYWK